MNDTDDQDALTHLPRILRIGPLQLDLFHRDVIIAGNWVRLHPREFEVVWKLAEAPGTIFSKAFLLKEVWRLDHVPETNRLEVHISRIRAKLRPFRLAGMIETHPDGGYRLALNPDISSTDQRGTARETLDTDARIGNDTHKNQS